MQFKLGIQVSSGRGGLYLQLSLTKEKNNNKSGNVDKYPYYCCFFLTSWRRLFPMYIIPHVIVRAIHAMIAK